MSRPGSSNSQRVTKASEQSRLRQDPKAAARVRSQNKAVTKGTLRKSARHGSLKTFQGADVAGLSRQLEKERRKKKG